nr:hypothetical protein [Pectobacterium odoriferum]
MIALAAAAIEAPDALFVMNSPYALDNEATTYISYPLNEIISKEAREATFADIVKKVAENKSRLRQQGCERLLAGACNDGESWTPAGKTHGDVPERDNHGTTWIYCNPHDRVMGSAPLSDANPTGEEPGYDHDFQRIYMSVFHYIICLSM